MRKTFFNQVGVTLLEIMLVLAIAAMVIVMSVRYYRAATTAQQTTVALQQITGYSAAADRLSLGTGDYSKVTKAAIAGTVGAANTGLPAQLGDFKGTATGYTLNVTLSSAELCSAVAPQISALPGMGLTGTCNQTNLTVTAGTLGP